MKDCPKDKVLFYLEGQLIAEEKEEFLAHLAICETCQRRLGEFERLRLLLKATSETTKEANFSRILSDFHRKIRVCERRFAWQLIFLPVGVVALILFFILQPRQASVYIPVNLSYYDLLENLADQDLVHIEMRLLTDEVDIEALKEELLTKISYEEVLEFLDKEEQEALIKRLIGGEL